MAETQLGGLAAVEKQIYARPETFDSMSREAAFYRWDATSFIHIKAWQIYQEEEIQKNCRIIQNDSAWLEHVRAKASNKGISLDEMIRMDAVYLWEQKLKKF